MLDRIPTPALAALAVTGAVLSRCLMLMLGREIPGGGLERQWPVADVPCAQPNAVTGRLPLHPLGSWERPPALLIHVHWHTGTLGLLRCSATTSRWALALDFHRLTLPLTGWTLPSFTPQPFTCFILTAVVLSVCIHASFCVFSWLRYALAHCIRVRLLPEEHS